MKTLVDTSGWIDHLRRGNAEVVDLLERDEVLIHPFVIGEIACGHLKNRKLVLESLLRLPSMPVATIEECLLLIENNRLQGLGLGIVDVHLLASALLSSARILTFDKSLRAAAEKLLP